MATVGVKGLFLSFCDAFVLAINKFVKLFSVPNSMNFVVPLN